MGTVRKKGLGYEAAVSRKGMRKSRMCRTKAEANIWIAETEKGILQGTHIIADKTFGDLMNRYAELVSPGKRGGAWELKRIRKLNTDPISKIDLMDLNQTHFAQWRDRRLKEVTEATVLRDWNLISHALTIASSEWKWLHANPLKGVRRPKPPPSRVRRFTQDEIDRLLLALGYDYTDPPVTISARVGASMLFAIETAMRAGEIASLTWDNIDLDRRVARLHITKNGFPRDVPLSAEAIRILNQVAGITESVNQTDNGITDSRELAVSVFNIRASQIDALFRKAKSRALIEDLHFHDTRAEAITRLAAKVDILTLARISGHRDLRMLQIYYREGAEDIAKRI